jgi:hypothetical protein
MLLKKPALAHGAFLAIKGPSYEVSSGQFVSKKYTAKPQDRY